VVYNTSGQPHVIVECKAPSIKINQSVFDQICRYNLTLKAKYLVLSNGLQHFIAAFQPETEDYLFLEDIPKY
jgi:hypothetical protein